MTKNDIYTRFVTEYPHFKSMVSGYKKNGKNSILISTITGKNIVYKVEGAKTSIATY